MVRSAPYQHAKKQTIYQLTIPKLLTELSMSVLNAAISTKTIKPNISLSFVDFVLINDKNREVLLGNSLPMNVLSFVDFYLRNYCSWGS